MKWGKKNSSDGSGSDSRQLWGKVIGIDDRTDQERTFTVYTWSGSLLVVDDKGSERLAGPANGSNKYNLLREIMVQFQVHSVRLNPPPNAKPHTV